MGMFQGIFALKFCMYFFKSFLFWDIMPCSCWKSQPALQRNMQLTSSGSNEECLLPLSCWFFAWFTLYLQSRKIRQAKGYTKHVALFTTCFRMLFDRQRCRRHLPPKHLLTFKVLHSITSHKTELFITTVVRTSSPACTTACFPYNNNNNNNNNNNIPKSL
jgi:hypothetical protein